MDCKSQTFSGAEGPVGLLRWFEKAESIFATCNCPVRDKVKYASGTLEDGALTWWNAQVQMLGIKMANATTWDDFKELMRDEYCPRDEVQKLENECYNLKMVGSEIEAYTKRSHELANTCPNLSRPPHWRIELYIKGDDRNDGNVVIGTFSVNDIFASVLFDSDADWSYVSLGFSRQLGLTPTPLETKHVVELVDGKSIEASHVLIGCKLDLLGQVFDIDLLPVILGSFDVVVGMEWLSKHRADILCKEKIIRIPLSSGEPLSVQGHRSGAAISIISAMKAQKCLRKGYHAILTLVTDTQPEEKRIEDLPVVREFPDVFPEELPGLPPYRQVEFHIDLTPRASLIARAPYRLAPGELQELSNQLQELLHRGFIRPSSPPWGAQCYS
ncbi:uncharacterized protein LOC110913793 [Helianthus annuus]|uniref:uncharacterized protein LOC110913793 n=1 Tax=Helianthus annuus TaxID=4232 RepID=UPI000B90911D|nr:uncharacterized protein LOC110913793 [Helianthus annuus]